MAQLPLSRQNQAGNAHINGATPSYLPTSINQPNQNMPHRSELSQIEGKNHQERHQSCPRTGGKTTRKDIRVVLFGDIDGATSVNGHFASKGRDALKPNFNKWPEEPFLDGKTGSSGHLLKLGFKASRPLLAQNNFRHFAKIRLGMPT